MRRGALGLAALLLAVAPAPVLAVGGNDTIVLVAGTPRTAGNAGDGGRATLATLSQPAGVVADSGGNFYIASAAGPAVRRVDPGGVITRYAGVYGAAGFNGDGIPATQAQLNRPEDVVLDAAGNVYVADHLDGRVRKIDRSGTITTVASGLGGPAGLAADDAGNVYVADAGGERVLRIAPGGAVSTIAGTGVAGFNGDGQPATSANLSGPTGVAVDPAGRVYIAEQHSNRIRRVDRDGIIHTIAGTGQHASAGDGGRAVDALLLEPVSVALDRAGNLYLSEASRLRKIDRAGIITTIAGNGIPSTDGLGGPARLAGLNVPWHLWVEPSGSLLITDQGSSIVRRIVNLPPSASFAASATGLTAAFDASASSGANDGIVEYAWDFGDGSRGAGQRPAHAYPRAGSYTVTLTVMDDSGAAASASRQVTVTAPQPPAAPISVTGARFAAKWRVSRLRGTLQVGLRLPRATRLQVELLGPGRSSRVRLAESSDAPAGRVRRILGLPPALLPGRYRVRVRDVGRGRRLASGERRVVLAAPPEGVVSRAWISLDFGGRERPQIIKGPDAIAANFAFAVPPARGRRATVHWFWSGRPPGPVRIRPAIGRPVAGSFLRNRRPGPTGVLPEGIYRAELRVGRTLVAVARTRIR